MKIDLLESLPLPESDVDPTARLVPQQVASGIPYFPSGDRYSTSNSSVPLLPTLEHLNNHGVLPSPIAGAEAILSAHWTCVPKAAQVYGGSITEAGGRDCHLTGLGREKLGREVAKGKNSYLAETFGD